MDEYSPRYYDTAELKYLCDSLNNDAILSLHKTKTHWINDLSSQQSTNLNELIEHVAAFFWKFKIKYPSERLFISLVDEYLDETYNLFGSPLITLNEFSDWQKMNTHLIDELNNDLKCSVAKL
ncbi:Hha toxicity modulator TomB [Moellerella wisconsensis]|uniref:Hha toxicity modulator TomB n=1 Tax=Moellerella wisconsensis TaxID=158849 RepID=UPI001F4ED24B|nr:Hha toxicity modulator TomB [Moellerella wisconsensis]UNH23670.1 Hha toxicity modulator TomB [Moellerella wisconsensis]